jgi:hypothetical protein
MKTKCIRTGKRTLQITVTGCNYSMNGNLHNAHINLQIATFRGNVSINKIHEISNTKNKGCMASAKGFRSSYEVHEMTGVLLRGRVCLATCFTYVITQRIYNTFCLGRYAQKLHSKFRFGIWTSDGSEGTDCLPDCHRVILQVTQTRRPQSKFHFILQLFSCTTRVKILVITCSLHARLWRFEVHSREHKMSSQRSINEAQYPKMGWITSQFVA